jgi:ABC-type Na+ efflux pump permease subunit
MHTHTSISIMAVPFGIVRASLQDLWKLDKAQCNLMLQSYNGTAAAAIAEPMTVALTVVLVMLLAFILFCTGLARMFSIRQTFNLEPVVRITFVLFLPVLSSVFTLTKAQGGTGFLLTLLWMLLVEVIRMKVQAMVLPADVSSFSRSAGRFTPMDNADEVGHMVWAGYLVFFNMGGHTGIEADKEWTSR